MLKLRSLDWPADRPALVALDTSFRTDRVYEVIRHARSFALRPVPVSPPLHKDYRFADDVDSLPGFDQVLVAERDAAVVGIAALKMESWNRRAVLWHLYVAPAERGRGVGRTLIDGVIVVARQHQARCIWLETQTINYDAIQFYQRVGFAWCGLDTSLYDPRSQATHEIALFFVYQLAPASASAAAPQ